MSLLSGWGLAVWVMSLTLGFGLLVERHVHNTSSFLGQVLLLRFWTYRWTSVYLLTDIFHNESSFWVKSCLFGFWPYHWVSVCLLKNMFIMSLLSGWGLAVWDMSLTLGFGLPVEKHVHDTFSFCCQVLLSGHELIDGLQWTCWQTFSQCRGQTITFGGGWARLAWEQ